MFSSVLLYVVMFSSVLLYVAAAFLSNTVMGPVAVYIHVTTSNNDLLHMSIYRSNQLDVPDKTCGSGNEC